MNHSFRGHYTERSRISLNNFEFNSAHTTTDNECVILVDGTVCLQKVWLKVNLKEVAAKTKKVKEYCPKE